MKLPKVSDFRLASVNATTSGKNGFSIASAVIEAKEGVAETVIGTPEEGKVIEDFPNGYNHFKEMKGTDTSQDYYLCTVQNRVTFENLTLTYVYAGN